VIRCLVHLDSGGCLEGFEASGHALRESEPIRDGGELDLVCAAVTTLLRTASRMLYRHPDIEADGTAPETGSMFLSVRRIPGNLRWWLGGVTDFLLAGLRDIEAEHPQSLQLVIRRKGTTDHGT
jgi:uncharacterized protein YsxB (DUF464 family)